LIFPPSSPFPPYCYFLHRAVSSSSFFLCFILSVLLPSPPLPQDQTPQSPRCSLPQQGITIVSHFLPSLPCLQPFPAPIIPFHLPRDLRPQSASGVHSPSEHPPPDKILFNVPPSGWASARPTPRNFPDYRSSPHQKSAPLHPKLAPWASPHSFQILLALCVPSSPLVSPLWPVHDLPPRPIISHGPVAQNPPPHLFRPPKEPLRPPASGFPYLPLFLLPSYVPPTFTPSTLPSKNLPKRLHGFFLLKVLCHSERLDLFPFYHYYKRYGILSFTSATPFSRSSY